MTACPHTRVRALVLGLLLLAAPATPATAAEPAWRVLKPSTGAPSPTRLQVRFFGVSTLLFDDGDTQLLIDGFFSRPRKTQVLSVKPDPEVIHDALDRNGVTRLAAVLTAHAHIDHGLDAPDVALQTGATLFGSRSVKMLAKGRKLPAQQFRAIKHGDVLRFGRFTVTVFESPHSPKAFFEGLIPHPLRPPAWVGGYRMGEANFSFLVEHGEQALLVHPSAHYKPGLFAGRKAHVVFLGIGTLGERKPGFAEEMWAHVVDITMPKVVVPIHWDDFSLPLSKPLKWAPDLLDNVPEGLRRIAKVADGPEVVRFLPPCDPVDLPVATGLDATDPAPIVADGWAGAPSTNCPGVERP